MFRILAALIANAFALLLAQQFLPDVILPSDLIQVLFIAAILTVLNFFLKPLLALILSPIIILTLGFGLLIVNTIIIYILDILSKQLTIQGNYLLNLFLVGLLVSLINAVIHWNRKRS